MLSEAFFRLTHTDRVLVVGSNPYHSGIMDAKKLRALVETLAGGHEELEHILFDLVEYGGTEEPLLTLQNEGFTPEAISDLYTNCGKDFYQMLLKIKEL